MGFTRSLINRSIELAREVFERYGIHLPPMAYWTVDQWRDKGPQVDEIRHCMLGWDVTDFGRDDFKRIGRTLLTLRNGRHDDPRYPKSYAEKLILNPEGQRAPAHFHRSKREDIANRAGGNMIVSLTAVDENDQPTGGQLCVSVDGEAVEIASGGFVRLEPGQSVCIAARMIHQFWGEQGTGISVSSEVSSVCDDRNDNFFLEPATRFPPIDEDEPARYYLCNEYPPSVS